MKGVCCSCQTVHPIYRASNDWLMAMHGCDGDHTVPQAIIPSERFWSCCQCVDRKTGQTGDFIHKGDKIAISPIFDNLADLYSWMKANGYKHEYYTEEGYEPFRVVKV